MEKQKLSKDARLRKIVIDGFLLLEDEKGYKQNQILNKMRTLDLAVSPASFSNILKQKSVGIDVLQKTAEGIQKIILSELGYQLTDNKFLINKPQDWQFKTIKETSLLNNVIENDSVLPGFVFHSAGRVTIPHKTNFILSAHSEVVEVGVRLKTFAEYFLSRNEEEYKIHIQALLKRGVKMRFYMLDPESNEARLYFKDREKAQKEEEESIEEMKKTFKRIEKIHAELTDKKTANLFELYYYKHIPNCHFYIVDGDSPNAKMMIAHYLYGLRRAECPVIEIDKRLQPALFKKYYQSFEAFIQEAKRVVPQVPPEITT